MEPIREAQRREAKGQAGSNTNHAPVNGHGVVLLVLLSALPLLSGVRVVLLSVQPLRMKS